MGGIKLTTGRRGPRVCEDHHTGFALVNKSFQSSLVAIMGLDLATKAVESDDVADDRLCGFR